MKLTLDVFEFLSAEEIKEECKHAISTYVYEFFCKHESDIDRIISNLGYEFVFEAVSKAIGKDAEKEITETVCKLMQDRAAIKYEMWRKKDAWERNESPAIKIMYETIEDNKALMRERIREVINDFDFPDVRDAMYDVACEVVSEKLFGGADNG